MKDKAEIVVVKSSLLILSAPNDQPENLITTNDPKFHGRVRRLLSNSFTEESLRSQHGLINSYAGILVSRLQSFATKPKNTTVGIIAS